MARRVRPGDSLNITAVEYNRLLAAADASHRNRLPGGAGPRTHSRNASTVRVHNKSGAVVPIGGIIGFESPITDPEAGPVELARFVRDATIETAKPTEDDHTGRVGVAIEPIRDNEVGRVVFDGVVAAQIDVTKTWHRFADVADSGGDTLQSKPDGSAQILWRKDPNQTGRQWAVVRVGTLPKPVYLAKVLSGGIPRREFDSCGRATCELATLSADGVIEPVLDAEQEVVEVEVCNPSRQRIRGPVETISETVYRVVRPDISEQWVIDPSPQTLLARPTGRVRAKSWGNARELRFANQRWTPSGNVVRVYNATDQTLLVSQHVVCHFHEDADAYLGVSSRCCDESSSSSSDESESHSSESESSSVASSAKSSLSSKSSSHGSPSSSSGLSSGSSSNASSSATSSAGTTSSQSISSSDYSESNSFSSFVSSSSSGDESSSADSSNSSDSSAGSSSDTASGSPSQSSVSKSSSSESQYSESQSSESDSGSDSTSGSTSEQSISDQDSSFDSDSVSSEISDSESSESESNESTSESSDSEQSEPSTSEPSTSDDSHDALYL